MPPGKRKEIQPEWLLTFGDMMALLLTFFVLLVGISNPDSEKFNKAIKSIQDVLGHSAPSNEVLTLSENKSEESFNALAVEVKEVIKDGNLQDVVEVEINEKGLILNIVGGALFKAGSALVQDGIKPLLLEVALMVKKLPYKIIVEGHTDNTKIRGGQFPSNWELSTARASAVVRVMIEEGGVNPARFSVVGYAEYRPLFAHTEENHLKNRRVEIIISREGQSS